MKKLVLALLGVCLVLLGVGIFASGCERGGYPIIENQRNENIRIFVTLISTDGSPPLPEEPIDYGIVPAETTRELAGISFIRRTHVRRIEAKDPSGIIVFSHDYNMNDLEKIKWTVVIPQ